MLTPGCKTLEKIPKLALSLHDNNYSYVTVL